MSEQEYFVAIAPFILSMVILAGLIIGLLCLMGGSPGYSRKEREKWRPRGRDDYECPREPFYPTGGNSAKANSMVQPLERGSRAQAISHAKAFTEQPLSFGHVPRTEAQRETDSYRVPYGWENPNAIGNAEHGESVRAGEIMVTKISR